MNISVSLSLYYKENKMTVQKSYLRYSDIGRNNKFLADCYVALAIRNYNSCLPSNIRFKTSFKTTRELP